MNKRLCTYAVALLTYTASAQHVDIGVNYNADIPFKQTMPMMSMNHGAGLFLGYKAKDVTPFSFVTDLSIGSFASQQRKEQYAFSDGTVTETYVNYSSNLHKFLFGLNFDLGKRDQLLSGYLTAQAGYALMNARIYIEDPNDPGGCKALVNKTTFNYGGGIYAAGGGVRVNIAKLRNKNSNFSHYIDIGVKYMGGGNFNYVNIKHMQEETHAMAPAGTGTTSPTPGRGNSTTQDLNVQFVNVTTNDIHEHKVAEIYTSKFQMLNLKIGYVIGF
jgi:hypothetical protein